MPNFVSVTPSIAKLACGEKSRTHSLTHSLNQSINHPAYLMCQEPKLSLWNMSTVALSNSLVVCNFLTCKNATHEMSTRRNVQTVYKDKTA